MEASEKMQKYFSEIEEGVNTAYKIANKARSQGYDPEDKVEIPLAKDISERVEGLISIVAPQIVNSGIVQRIKELEREYGSQDWRVALKIAEEVAKEKFCKFKDQKEAMEVGIRVGFAYVTVGVVVSPLEGFVKLEIKKRKDGRDYISLFYSGPIRSAGGTGASISVIIADYVRKKLGYSTYDITEEEIKRNISETHYYHERGVNLQYLPSEEELDFLLRHLPVQIDGDPSEQIEVMNYKDLERIQTNRLRNGVALVLAECLSPKAPKIYKQLSRWGKDFNLENWNFLEKFLEIQKKVRAKGAVKKEASIKIEPDYNYLKDLVAGRPIITHPSRKGGLRLRYGRARNSGFSADAIHPATQVVLADYIAIGTQLKCERPKKSDVVVSCDSLEGPIVKLNNGSVVVLETKEQAKQVVKDIEEIIFLGDILINYGDFLNRAHVLIPPGYCEEWWIQELIKKEPSSEKFSRKIGIEKEFAEILYKNPKKTKISADIAIEISKKLKIPLHPRYTFHWKDIDENQFNHLIKWLKSVVVKREDKEIKKIIFSIEDNIKNILEEDNKRILEILGVPHMLATNEYIVIEGDYAKAFAASMGFYEENLDQKKIEAMEKSRAENSLQRINNISEVKLRDKSGYFVGMRMGRPEKAKIRKLAGSPQGLFPVGDQGGKLRSFQSAFEKDFIESEFPIYECTACNKHTVLSVCETCDKKTAKKYYCSFCNIYLEKGKCEKHGDIKSYKNQKIRINTIFKDILKNLKLKQYPNLIKGVKGTSNKEHIPENLGKIIIRASHNLYVNKDGTIRYDMTELPITHFKPKEIGISLGKLKELGYSNDIYGNNLVNEGQILEIMLQDIILPSYPISSEEGADEILIKVSKFIDDCLIKLYKQKAFYNIDKKEDLIGHYVIGLSPHTSAGIVTRIIGFSKTQGLLAHPYTHSIMRRDCDGDEACVILLMDALLNFSRKFLPDHRGATQDEPLVLTTKIIPSEVDDMVFDMDIADYYPLEFYEACNEYKMPWEINIKTIKQTLNTEKQYEGMLFTHDTNDINEGSLCSSYKTIPTMQEKVQGQMELAEKIRAVDESDVARLLIERHFIRDIKGNMRKFSMQQFRCVNCNEKYRRPPLTGICLKCHGRIIFTISEGSIIKYLEPALSLADKYDIPLYLKQSLELTKQRIESIFGKETEKQEGLGRWF